MADLRLYTASDLQQAADISGFSVFEFDTVWTDAALHGLMTQFFSGELQQIVDPGQKISPEDTEWIRNAAKASVEDVANFFATLPTPEDLLPTLSLGLIAVIGIAVAVIVVKLG